MFRTVAHPSSRAVTLAILAIVASCSGELPSTRPLGRGPLAGRTVNEAPPPTTAQRASSDEAAEDAGGGMTAPSTADAAGDEAPGIAAADGAADAGAAGRSPAAGVSFAGDFYGKDTNVMRMPGMPATPEEDPKARVTVTEERDKTLAFALYGEGGKVACTLHATASGNSARFSAGEKCFDDPRIASRVSRGTARIDGDLLTLELVFDMEFRVSDQSASGSLEYRFEGRRKK